MDEPEEQDSRVQELLLRHPRGLTARAISSALGEIPSYRVRGILSKLQERGLVRLNDSGRWQYVGPVAKPRAASGNVRVPAAAPPDRQAVQGNRAEGTCIGASRWNDFRRICLYYADCVRIEDRPSILDYAEQENKRFVSVCQSLDWRALSAGSPVAISIPDEWADFVKHVKSASRGKEPRLFIGLPVNVTVGRNSQTGEQYSQVAPIFVLQVACEIKDGVLHLEPSGSVEVNYGWLAANFKKPEDAAVLLEICGLETNQGAGEDDVGQDIMPDFEEAFSAYGAHYPDHWREQADLRRLVSQPPLQEIKQGGVYNRAMLVCEPKLKYAEKLHQELLFLANEAGDEELDATSLRRLFPYVAAHDDAGSHKPGTEVESADPQSVSNLRDMAEYQPLNKQQREACRAAMSASALVVTGPPGTGKSRVVAHVMANAALRRKPVLFASKNHQAIEAVVPRLNDVVAPNKLVIRVSMPFGESGAESLTQSLISVLATPKPSDVLERLADDLARLDSLLDRRNAAEARTRSLFELYARVDESQKRLSETLADLPESYSEIALSCPKVPDTSEVEALHVQLSIFLQPPEALPKRLVWLLRRAIANRRLVRRANETECAYCTTVAEAPLILSRLSDRETLLSLLSNLDRWQQLSEAIVTVRELLKLRQDLGLQPSLADCHKQHITWLERVPAASVCALNDLAVAFGANLSGETKQLFAEVRAELQNYGENLERRESKKLQSLLRRSFGEIVKELPLWATSNLSAGSKIPKAAAAFDLLIIDEASQCDIASVVPLMFRAKRVMVVGDPMQLPHVSSLPKRVEHRLRQKHGLTDTRFARFTYRVNSFFSLADSDAKLAAKIRLEDHHRSHPLIAGYCNKTFYTGTLRVMTDIGNLTRNGALSSGFAWTSVPADAERASRSGSISRGQIEAVLQELRRLKRDRFPGSVGVVTPFRIQANRIRDAVHQAMGSELPEHWRLIVDTADGFQGDERDIILMSLPCGPDLPRGSLWFLRDAPDARNRFNVAVSRARVLLHVFADEDWCRSCKITHIEQLWNEYHDQQNTADKPFREDLVGPVWEPKLAERLQRESLDFKQQYPACGRYLDFAMFRDGRKLDVEVDGESTHRDSGGRRKIDDLERDLALIANGWTVLRFWVYELREDMDKCISQIKNALNA